MVINCDQVLNELSNYIDGDLDPALREEIEKHLAQCRHCCTAYDSTRNVVVLIADERLYTLPVGFHERLRGRLAAELDAD